VRPAVVFAIRASWLSGRWTLVDGALVRDRAGGRVDDGLAVPVDDEVLAVGDLTDDGGEDVPLLADGHERVDVLRHHDRAHALLRLAGEHLGRRHARGAHGDALEVDVHAAVTGRGQLGRGTGQTGAAEVLDADDELLAVQVETALDEHLLGEGVAHLHGGELLRAAARRFVEGLRREDGHAADAVEAGTGTEQDDLVADAGRERQVQVLDAHRARAQRVDERVALVGRVEHRLAADVREAERVAVAADAAHDAVDDATGVGVVGRAEPQLVHDRDRAGAHRHDVADDAADAGRGALVRLDVRRVVVGFDLEGDGPAVADVDDACVLTDACEHRGPHLVGGGLAEVLQVHLRRLVRAVLGPHHRVHRQLGVRGTATEDLPDTGVLVVLESQFPVGLGDIGGRGGLGDGIDLR
jgi:hypothetical protein